MLPPILTSTSYSVWLAAKKEARAERAEKVETSSKWLAPAPLRLGETGDRVCGAERSHESMGESLADTVRRGLLRAGGSHPEISASIVPSSPVASLADQVRAGLMMAGASCVPSAPHHPETTNDWVLPEAKRDNDKEDMEDDSSIVTLDTVTDSSLDLEQFDVMEDTAPLLATWIAK